MNKMFGVLRSKGVQVGTAAAAVSLTATSNVHAVLPAAATTALGDVATGITDAVDGAWPLIGAALAAGIVIKLVKRFTNKV